MVGRTDIIVLPQLKLMSELTIESALEAERSFHSDAVRPAVSFPTFKNPGLCDRSNYFAWEISEKKAIRL